MFQKNSLLLGFLLTIPFLASAEIKLPKLISEGMVLQRDAEVKIWGWADPKETVKVKFLDAIYTAVANDSGNWEINLSNLKAGGPYTMELKASNLLTLSNILVGDVWICSGQSNMEISMARVSPLYPTEIAEANYPMIRYFEVPKKYDFNTPQQDISGGQWQAAAPENILKFSAVSYFFALELYQKYGIPIGLINTALGGSPAESWISEAALKKFPEHYQEAQRFKDPTLIEQIEKQDNTRRDNWYKELRALDAGYHNADKPWYLPETNTADWGTMTIPGFWAEQALGSKNGVVWFQKDLQIPETMANQAAKLNLGRIVDADSVFVNGVFVGTTSYQYPPRRYEIPAGVLKTGKNTLVVRVINSSGKGGFVTDKPYELVSAEKTIDLSGDWHFKLGAEMPPLEGPTFIRWKPVGLYNAMIAPLLNYRMKGVIWYQGESNTKKPDEYHALLSTLIQNWRADWQQGDFPFLIVQLANYLEAISEPSESDWALLREAQLQTLSLPNTGMAVIIDIGEWNDIHPLNKKDVGKRLALAAQKIAYGEKKIVASGPLYQSMKIKGNKIILTFKSTGSGLMIKEGKMLKEFAIAGADQKFVWADAVIKKGKVIVSSDQIANPVAVRYAWASNPEGANLYNKEGLPASPFRTDDWK